MQYIQKITDSTYMIVDDKLEFDNFSDVIKYSAKVAFGTFFYCMIVLAVVALLVFISRLF